PPAGPDPDVAGVRDPQGSEPSHGTGGRHRHLGREGHGGCRGLSTTRGPRFVARAGGGVRSAGPRGPPPYTLWHLSYVAIGASLASVVNGRWLAESLVAFFLGVGVGAPAVGGLHGPALSD